MHHVNRRIATFIFAFVIGISVNGYVTAQGTAQKSTEDISLSGRMDRAFWIAQLDKLARPVLSNMAQDNLKKNMPVLVFKRTDNPDLEKENERFKQELNQLKVKEVEQQQTKKLFELII